MIAARAVEFGRVWDGYDVRFRSGDGFLSVGRVWKEARSRWRYAAPGSLGLGGDGPYPTRAIAARRLLESQGWTVTEEGRDESPHPDLPPPSGGRGEEAAGG